MDTTRIIKILVILELALFVIYLILSFLSESWLPVLLQEYLTNEMEKDFDFIDMVVLLIGIPILLMYMVSVVGLLCGKYWSKYLYATLITISYLTGPFIGPTVEHALTATIYDLANMTSGGILALLFLSVSEFNKPNHSDAH